MSYVFNYGMVVNAVTTMMWPFIPESYKSKFKMLSLEAMMEFIDRDQLPVELQGTASYTLEEKYAEMRDLSALKIEEK